MLDLTGLSFASTFTKTESFTNSDEYVYLESEITFTDSGVSPVSSAGDAIILDIDDFMPGTFSDTTIRNNGLELIGKQMDVLENG